MPPRYWRQITKSRSIIISGRSPRLASNTTFTVTPDANGKVAFDGLELTFTGTPAVNDSFTLKPVSDAIVNMDVLITDEAKIAMASEEDAGDSDNRNGQALLDLQSNSKTVGRCEIL
ncbi:flagellar hook-associated protein 1 [Escherichia coli]|uniref:Flagellar hook-associated protein 1 n=1 Tax=Escherichia coli TaxID=562 RepID=A0A2X1IXP3_ECOLX|nr:flagellar hook-associated protein 1 [Escherichia coli]